MLTRMKTELEPKTKPIRVGIPIHRAAKVAASNDDKSLQEFTESALTEKLNGKPKKKADK